MAFARRVLGSIAPACDYFAVPHRVDILAVKDPLVVRPGLGICGFTDGFFCPDLRTVIVAEAAKVIAVLLHAAVAVLRPMPINLQIALIEMFRAKRKIVELRITGERE